MDSRKNEKDENDQYVKKPQFFAQSFMDDPQNYFYAKASYESRINNTNLQSSPAMLEHSIKNDNIWGLKLGFKYNKNFIPNCISKCFNIHASNQFKTNF